MKALKLLALVAAACALVLVGRWSAPATPADVDLGGVPSLAAQLWTCPMHPQIKLPSPGSCPICGMALVPLASGDDAGPRAMAMSPEAVRLAEIRTTPVERRFVTLPVRMVGKLDYDETAVKTISAWVAGRLERLFVDYTGVPVQTGEHLFELYSPELSTAQEELLASRQRLMDAPSEESGFLRRSSERAYQAARRKLVLWGLSEEQVDEVERRGTAEDRITINSPSTGTVIRKHVDQGAYVQTGTPVYTIADLGRLWVQLHAYEQDLPWLRYGQDVSIQVEAFPGEAFQGWISFIDPVVHEHTRTANVRVNVPNPEGRLKPGMFVRAISHARLGEGGRVLSPRLSGKWVSPMHPEIVKDEPGTCDVCGMDLVPAAELGYVDEADLAKPLVVPASAVLVTGTRAVAYVEQRGTEKPTYEGREIRLGPRAGDDYIVRSGLVEGELVVTHGAFRIDSSMQIRAKPSMLSLPPESGWATGPEAGPFRRSLQDLYAGYLALQHALAADDAEGAAAASAVLSESLADVRPETLPRNVMGLWEEAAPALRDAVARVADTTDVEARRAAFADLSRSVIGLASTFGIPGTEPLHEAFCPMAAEGKGASWLQAGEEIANPYFGSAMLRCGALRSTYLGADVPAPPPQAPAGVPQEHAEHDPRAAREADATAKPILLAYLRSQAALAEDDLEAARAALRSMADSLAAVQAPDEAGRDLRRAVEAAGAASELESVRRAFAPVSEGVLVLLETRGNASGEELHEVFCPMAFDGEGGVWVQAGETVANPYFGASMLRCGTLRRAFPVE